MVPLSGTVAAPPPNSDILGPSPAATRITVDVSLRPRDPAGLDAFVQAVSTPGNPRYHQYLAPGQFDSVFGPTPATIAATRAWLASTGLQVGATSGGLLIPVTGTDAQVESAFRVPLVRAHLADGRTVRLATRDPSLPADLAASVTGVIGLSDQSTAQPSIVHQAPLAVVPGPALVAPHSAGPQACSTITGHSEVWTATQLAQTYGLSDLYANGRVGAGQTVGIFELEPFTASDIQAYQSCYGTHVPVATVPVDGGASGTQHGEAALDIEVVAGLAPGASITVYSGPNNGGTGPIDTYNAMISADSAKVLSVSWGQCEPMMDPNERATEHTLFAKAATQGQTVLAASGDAGSSDCLSPNTPSETGLAVDDPADQPDVTGVGGTSLTAATADAPTETVWNSDGGASGGGDSTAFAAAAWQQVPAAQSIDTTYTCGSPANHQCREVPDVSASADPNHGDAVYWSGAWWPFGGTSQAAPLWAALVADTNQGCAAPGGLINPDLYAPGSDHQFQRHHGLQQQQPGRRQPVRHRCRLRPGHRVGEPAGRRAPGPAVGVGGRLPDRHRAQPGIRSGHRRLDGHHHRFRLRHRDPGGPLRRGLRPGHRVDAHIGHRGHPRRHVRGDRRGDGHHVRHLGRNQPGGGRLPVHLRVAPGLVGGGRPRTAVGGWPGDHHRLGVHRGVGRVLRLQGGHRLPGAVVDDHHRHRPGRRLDVVGGPRGGHRTVGHQPVRRR